MIKFKLSHIYICFLLAIFTGYAQLNDLGSIDYTIIPGGNSNIQYDRLKVFASYPIKLKKEGAYIFAGISYSDIGLDFKKDDLSFDKEQLSNFKLIDLTFSYTQKIKKDWRFATRIKPGLSTNLKASSLSYNDLTFAIDVIFLKERDLGKVKKDRIILGLSYAENRGFSFPLPFISYFRKFHEKWAYTIGVPKFNLQYYASKKHRIKLYAELDGFTSNIQNNLTLDDGSEVDRINMSLILSGLQYEYHIGKHLELYAQAAYNISVKATLRNGNENLLTIDNKSRLYTRAGLRFKI